MGLSKREVRISPVPYRLLFRPNPELALSCKRAHHRHQSSLKSFGYNSIRWMSPPSFGRVKLAAQILLGRSLPSRESPLLRAWRMLSRRKDYTRNINANGI